MFGARWRFISSLIGLCSYADNVLFAAAVLYGYGDAARVLIFSPIQDVLKSENQQMFRPTIEEDVMRQVRLYHSGVKGHDMLVSKMTGIVLEGNKNNGFNFCVARVEECHDRAIPTALRSEYYGRFTSASTHTFNITSKSSHSEMTDFTDVSKAFQAYWQQETIQICLHDTSRTGEKVNSNILKVRDYIFGLTEEFNETQKATRLEPFTWCKTGTSSVFDPDDNAILDADYTVFGLRFGAEKPKHKLSLICHLDNVPAESSSEWNPFNPTVESRDFEDGTEDPQDFLVGRGCMDDKGPAISAFIVARCLAKAYDSSPKLDHIQIELLFDSSEETDMSTPYYLEDPETRIPEFGIVYDASWCVRAEKGAERPRFTMESTGSAPSDGTIYVKSLNTPTNNSTSTIPDEAVAEICCSDIDKLKAFGDTVIDEYKNFNYDDPNYNRASINVSQSSDGSALLLQTKVSGAQHGSMPHENRRSGSNPLVSLANFLAGLADQNKLAKNHITGITKFIQYTFGTYVFGELQKEELYRFDDVFVENNGTTYAVTKSTTEQSATNGAASGKITLEIDIRYALDHHSTEWDGSEGLLDGDLSKLGPLLQVIVYRFNKAESASYPQVYMDTSTIFAPDVRTPDTNAQYQSIEKAFKEEMGYDPPRYALGGGTDAKGHLFLYAAGALFTANLGPPINYHGINEGAPIVDMEKSTRIMHRIFLNEIENSSYDPSRKKLIQKSMHRVKQLRRHGYKFVCTH